MCTIHVYLYSTEKIIIRECMMLEVITNLVGNEARVNSILRAGSGWMCSQCFLCLAQTIVDIMVAFSCPQAGTAEPSDAQRTA